MAKSWLNQYLSTDLLQEILRRLPVKSLLRFLSVSKTWRSIIHNTEFVKSYKYRPESQIYVLDSKSGVNIECGVRSSKHEEEKADLFEIFHRTWSVIGCVDGLLLFEGSRLSRHLEQQRTLVIWNPSIRRFLVLPHPQQHSVSLGLGFHQDYKHVRCVVDKVGPSSYSLRSVLVYSLETNSWKSKRFEPPTQWRFYRNLYHERVCSRGALYFLAVSGGSRNYSIGSQVVVSFDLRNEEFSWVKSPIIVDDENPSYSSKWLVKGCDSFGLAEIKLYKGTIWWAHGEGCEVTWSKRYTFAVSGAIYGYARDVLWVDDIKEQALLDLGDHVTLYDLKSHKDEIVFERDMFLSNLRVFPYVESLVLLGYKDVKCGRWD